MALCHQVTVLSRETLERRLGILADEDLGRIDRSLGAALAQDRELPETFPAVSAIQ